MASVPPTTSNFKSPSISRSRRQLLVATSSLTKPSRDLNSVLTHNDLFFFFFFLVATQPGPTQLSKVATPISGRDLKLTRPVRDLKVMSQPQIAFPRSQHEFHVTTKDPSVLTSSRSRHQKDVATPTPPVLVATLKQCRDLALSGPGRARWSCYVHYCGCSRPSPAHPVSSCHDLKTWS